MTFASTVRVALATLTLAVGLGATPLGTMTHYDVTMTERDAGAGSERGTLDLRISTDGIVTGRYRDFDAHGPFLVSGGRHGDRIWLDYRDVRVTATLGPRSIDGRAFRSGGSTEYVFHAILDP